MLYKTNCEIPYKSGGKVHGPYAHGLHTLTRTHRRLLFTLRQAAHRNSGNQLPVA